MKNVFVVNTDQRGSVRKGEGSFRSNITLFHKNAKRKNLEEKAEMNRKIKQTQTEGVRVRSAGA